MLSLSQESRELLSFCSRLFSILSNLLYRIFYCLGKNNLLLWSRFSSVVTTNVRIGPLGRFNIIWIEIDSENPGDIEFLFSDIQNYE